MNRRSLLWLALAAIVLIALFHGRGSGPPHRPPYGQLKEAIRQGPARVDPAEAENRRLDSLDAPKVLALDDSKLLLASLRRIWSAEEQKQPIPEDAALVSHAADAVILTEAFVPFDPKELLSAQDGWSSLLDEPNERIVAIEDALRRIGDAPLLKVLQAMAAPSGKNAGTKPETSPLNGFTLPKWNEFIAPLSSSELEARLVTFVRAHPGSTILQPLTPEASEALWSIEKSWKPAAIRHVGVLKRHEAAERQARIDALPMAQLLKQSDYNLLESVKRRVDKKASEVDLAGLTPLERATFLLPSLVAEVGNGGFDQYFSNSTGDFAVEARDALRLVHADKAADVFARALAFFPEATPAKNFVARDDQIERIRKANPQAWEALNREFWGAPSEEINAKLVAAVRAAPDQIQPVATAHASH